MDRLIADLSIGWFCQCRESVAEFVCSFCYGAYLSFLRQLRLLQVGAISRVLAALPPTLNAAIEGMLRRIHAVLRPSAPTRPVEVSIPTFQSFNTHSVLVCIFVEGVDSTCVGQWRGDGYIGGASYVE